jgi:hypothetical protein
MKLKKTRHSDIISASDVSAITKFHCPNHGSLIFLFDAELPVPKFMLKYLRFGVLIAVKMMSSSGIWHCVVLCMVTKVVGEHITFVSALRMEVIRFSETLLTTYKT